MGESIAFNVRQFHSLTMENAQTAPLVRLDYLEPAELARELDVSERTIHRWSVLRIGPPRVTIGRTVLYRRESVRQWLASREERQGRTSGRRLAAQR
jgi:predicted DNA-binding transcriptional regulator AlpA